ncbi:MAG: CcmD family protein [Taibaiella sp.]|nr:CcmD family protein [Taibaiella sp.]
MRKASFLSFLYILLMAATASAQQAGTEMADTMRSNGKIYVVVLVLATIFVGIIVYLIRLERKITKLEKNK